MVAFGITLLFVGQVGLTAWMVVLTRAVQDQSELLLNQGRACSQLRSLVERTVWPLGDDPIRAAASAEIAKAKLRFPTPDAAAGIETA